MRKLSFLLLLATVAAPALAATDDGPRDRDRRNASADTSESRAQRATENRRLEAREQRATENRGSVNREQRASDARRSERAQPDSQGMTARPRGNNEQQRLQPRQQVSTRTDSNDNARALRRSQRQQEASNQAGGNDGSRTLRRSQRDGVNSSAQTDWRPRERQVRTIPDTSPVATQQAARERSAVRDRNRRDYRDGNYTRWSSSQWHNWRHDRRYDWRDYRNRHHSIFRIGFYNDPFGWTYRPWSIGSFLYPSYYGAHYWMNDPWRYRLPPAYGPYRWVRYWNDALLVNIYTGEVADVIHGFFW